MQTFEGQGLPLDLDRVDTGGVGGVGLACEELQS